MGNFRIPNGGLIIDRENLPSADLRYGPYANVETAHAALARQERRSN